MKRRVVVTGMGAVTPIGVGVDTFWDGIVKEKIGFDSLPPELREIARLRYEDRELSNSEIASMLSESLTVSGVNHRFKRLIKIAEDLKK